MRVSLERPPYQELLVTPLKPTTTSSKVVPELLLDVLEMLPEVLDLSWTFWVCLGDTQLHVINAVQGPP